MSRQQTDVSIDLDNEMLKIFTALTLVIPLVSCVTSDEHASPSPFRKERVFSSFIAFSKEDHDFNIAKLSSHCLLFLKRVDSLQQWSFDLTSPALIRIKPIPEGRYMIDRLRCGEVELTPQLSKYQIHITAEKTSYLGHFFLRWGEEKPRLDIKEDHISFLQLFEMQRKYPGKTMIFGFNGNKIFRSMSSLSHQDLLWEPTPKVRHPKVLGSKMRECFELIDSPYFFGTASFHVQYKKGKYASIKKLRSAHPYSSAFENCINKELKKSYLSHEIDALYDFSL